MHFMKAFMGAFDTSTKIIPTRLSHPERDTRCMQNGAINHIYCLNIRFFFYSNEEKIVDKVLQLLKVYCTKLKDFATGVKSL